LENVYFTANDHYLTFYEIVSEEQQKRARRNYYAFKPIHDNPIFWTFPAARIFWEIHKNHKERSAFPNTMVKNWSAIGIVRVSLCWEGSRFLRSTLYDHARRSEGKCVKMLEVFFVTSTKVRSHVEFRVSRRIRHSKKMITGMTVSSFC
jgi:hypothetical protein